MSDIETGAAIVALVSLIRKAFPMIDGRLYVAALAVIVGGLVGAAAKRASGGDWKAGALEGIRQGLAAFGAVHVADRMAGGK